MPHTFKKIFSLLSVCLLASAIPTYLYYKHKKPHPTYTASHLLWRGSRPVSPSEITVQQAKYDIGLLLYALEHAYGGKGFINKELFDSVKKALTDLYADVPIDQTISTTDFVQKIDTILLRIPDLHLKIHLPNKEGFFGDTSAARQKEEKRERGRVGHNRNQTTQPWSVEIYPYKKKKLLVIAITHFPPFQSQQWNGFIEKVTHHLNNVDGMIIDLRGNTGGADRAARELAKLVYGHDHFPHPVEAIYMRKTAEAVIIFANNIKRKKEQLAQKGEDTTAIEQQYDYLQELAKAYQGEPDSLEKRSLVCPPIQNESAFKKPIYILIDRSCGSSGETSIDFFAHHPHCLTIGENTYGCIHFGNMGFFFLPYSKLCVTMGIQFRKYRDNRFIEKKGISPMIKVPPGKDAFQVALHALV